MALVHDAAKAGKLGELMRLLQEDAGVVGSVDDGDLCRRMDGPSPHACRKRNRRRRRRKERDEEWGKSRCITQDHYPSIHPSWKMMS